MENYQFFALVLVLVITIVLLLRVMRNNKIYIVLVKNQEKKMVIKTKEKKNALKRGWRIIRTFGGQQLLRKRNWQFFWDPEQRKASYWHKVQIKI